MTKNIFRKALIILSTKSGQDMSDGERELVATALIPLMLSPEYSDKPICKGLKNLAEMIENE